LEEIVKNYATAGKWPAMWMTIKWMLNNYKKECPPKQCAQLKKLEELEKLAAPADRYSEIEAYVLTKISDHTKLVNVDNTEFSEEIYKKIEKLGKDIISEPEYLERLASKLWKNNIDTLEIFGKGLAKYSPDKRATFDLLIRLMKQQELEVVQPILFCGF